MTKASHSVATLAGGCFWCTEAVFQRVKGVEKVISGYTGGKRENPTYEQVSTVATGHTEAVQITYDPSSISYEKLLEIFWATHDATTLNQQGADKGTQYRSAIFYHSEQQKKIAQASKNRLVEEKRFKNPIVTQIVPFTTFYKAEAYHQNFYNSQSSYPYCRVIIDPKIKKLMSDFQKEVKEE